MKIKIFVLLTLLSYSALAGLSLNLNSCQTQQYESWNAFYCPCSGGSGNYDFQYSQLPSGWYANQNRIYFPKGQIDNSKYYGAKVSITDKGNKQSVKRSLIFNIDNSNRLGRVWDTDFGFNYDDQNALGQFLKNVVNVGINNAFNANIITPTASYGSNSGAAYGYNVQVVPQGPQIVQSNNNNYLNAQYNQQVGSQILQQVVSQPNIRNNDNYNQYSNNYNANYNSNNPYYSVFPTDVQIQTLLNNGDCNGLRNTIIYVSQSKFDCNSRIKFLDQLQSKITSHVAIFQTNADKYKSTITQLQAQKNALQAQINNGQYNGGRYNNGYDDLDNQIRNYQLQIDQHNRDRNDFNIQISKYQSNLNDYNSQINQIRSSSDSSRNIVDQQNRKIASIDAQITQLQAQINSLQQDKASIYNNVLNHKKICDDADEKIKGLNAQIANCNTYINQFQVKYRDCESNINELNRKINDCNVQIKNRQGQNNQYNINQLQAQIAAIDQQIASNTQQANRVLNLYNDLQNSQNDFIYSISSNYYGCYQFGNNNNNNNNNPFDGQFTTNNQAFFNYMKDIFGQSYSDNIRARFTNVGTLNIKRNNIYSPAWTKVYGIPFSAGYGSNADFQQADYSCSSDPVSNNYKVFNGKVDSINKNIMNVIGGNGDRYTVYLGSCTKIESIGDKDIPTKGSDICFKGNDRKGGDKGHYDGYHVTCY